MKKGKLVVFSGPSGTGKGTILKELIKQDNYAFSVSMTTRGPREGEADGVDYYFVTEEEFQKTIDNGGFLEYVHKFQRSYGTPKAAVFDQMEKGINVVLDIEMEGALNVKRIFPEAVLVFVLPPSLEELHRRLVARGTETEEQIAIRTKDIQKEIEFISNYDYYIVNDKIEDAVKQAKAIVENDSQENRITDASEIIAKYKAEIK